MASSGSAKGTARSQRQCQRAFVHIIKLAAHRQAMGELADGDAERGQPVGDIVHGGLAFHGGVNGEDDFLDGAGLDAGGERFTNISRGTARPPRLAREYVLSTIATKSGRAFSVECPWQESNPWGSVLRVICVTIEQSYNRAP